MSEENKCECREIDDNVRYIAAAVDKVNVYAARLGELGVEVHFDTTDRLNHGGASVPKIAVSATRSLSIDRHPNDQAAGNPANRTNE